MVREKEEIERKDDEGLFNALIIFITLFFFFIEAGIAAPESLTGIMCRRRFLFCFLVPTEAVGIPVEVKIHEHKGWGVFKIYKKKNPFECPIVKEAKRRDIILIDEMFEPGKWTHATQ